MKVPWLIDRCVLCLVTRTRCDEQTWLTDAHVIPASVGGRLSCRFLCRACNSRIGGEIEAPLVSDPGIRACVEALADQLPAELLKNLRQRQRWFVETDLGHINSVGTSEGNLMPVESTGFRREENAKAEMVADWRRIGMSEAEIAQHLATFDAATPGSTLLLPGFTVRPRVDLESLDFALPYDEQLVADTLPLGIAFLYLCLILGKGAYSDQLSAVRSALLANDVSLSAGCSVHPRIDRRGCAPEHRLAIKQAAPLIVHVQLFQERVWWVEFAELGMRQKPPLNYGIDVGRGEEFTW
jgi:hypothetical protein